MQLELIIVTLYFANEMISGVYEIWEITEYRKGRFQLAGRSSSQQPNSKKVQFKDRSTAVLYGLHRLVYEGMGRESLSL